MKNTNHFLNSLAVKFNSLDLRNYAIVSLLVLWVGTAFSIALMEISVVCGLIFWMGWKIQLKTVAMPSLPSPNAAIGATDTGFTPNAYGNIKAPLGAQSNKIDWTLWIPLALFCVMVIASFFTSEYPKQSFRGLYKIAKPLLVFFMLGNLFGDPRSQKRFDTVFLLRFLVMTIDCSIQYAFGKDLLRLCPAQNSSAGIRLPGPFGSFSKMASYLILAIPVFAMQCWTQFIQPDHRRKGYYQLILTLSGILLLYLTRSRGPVLALGLSFAALFIYNRWFKTLGIVGLLCLSFLNFAPRGMIVHLDAQNKEQSIVERVELWKRAWNVIEAKPWLGTGINTYNDAHEKYDKEKNWRVRGYYAHNGYLQLGAEIGIPGILFFLIFLFMFFRRSLQAANQVRGSPEELLQLGLLVGLLSFLLYAAVDNNLQRQ